MSEELPVPIETDALVAFTPGDLRQAQVGVREWIVAKMEKIRSEVKDASENYDIAVKNKWRASGWASRVSAGRAEMKYYEKLLAAVNAGYLIIPNFPIDVFAIRVRRARPKPMMSASLWDKTQGPQKLPAGAGRYVDTRPIVRKQMVTRQNPQTKAPEEVARYWADAYDHVSFPVTVVKPSVMNATAKAMAGKFFDQIGLVGPASRTDPIVVGQILGPRDKRITFFVAWWLTPEML